MQVQSSQRSLIYILLVCAVIGYLALVLPTISIHGISYDEHVDLTVAASYGAQPLGWLRGSDLDSANVRLPMYLSGIAFEALGDFSITWSRLLSCVLGVSTLIAVFLYCMRHLDRTKAVIACIVLATSPYFLAFSKVAMTEGDIFIACLTAWLLLCVASLQRESNVRWITATGLVLGLALSSKASAAALVPATILLLLLPLNESPAADKSAIALPWQRVALYLLLMLVVIVVVFTGLWHTYPSDSVSLSEKYSRIPDHRIVRHYLLAFIPFLSILVVAYLDRNRTANKWVQVLLVGGIAGTTFFVIPPVHTTNPAILHALFDAFVSSNDTFSWAFAGEALALHVLVILLKPSVLIGAGLWLAVISAVWQWRRRPELRLLLVFFIAYLAFLVLKMPRAQTFYMMPLLPIMVILLADQLTELYRRRRVAALALAAAAVAAVTVDLIRVYPDYHLNGYQWVGARYLAGRSTIGYRGIVQTPSDGVEQMALWSKINIPLGERAVRYVWGDHILRDTLGQAGFLIRNGHLEDVDLDEANYVLVSINATLDEGWGKENPQGNVYKYPYDVKKLERDFRKVFTVKRAFGIEVATIWYRKVPYEINAKSNIVGYLTQETGLARHPTVF